VLLRRNKTCSFVDIEELPNSWSSHRLDTALAEIPWLLLYAWYQVTFYYTGPCNEYHDVFISLLHFRTRENFCFSVMMLKVDSYLVIATLQTDEVSKEISSSFHELKTGCIPYQVTQT